MRKSHSPTHDTARLLRELEALTAWQRVILQGANLSIIATDTDGTIVSFNRAAEQMLGYAADDVVGKTSPAIFHDLDEVVARAAVLTEELGQSIEPGFDVFVAKTRLGLAEELEWTYVRKDGSRFPVLLSVTALRNDDGEILGYLGIGMDITERQQLENTATRLRENALSHALINALGKSIICINRAHDNTIRFINRAAGRMFGCNEDTVTGQPLASLFDEAGSGRDALGTLLRLQRDGDATTWLKSMGTGMLFPAECRLANIEHIGGDAMLMLSIRDISTQHAAEQKQRLSDRVFQHSSEGIMITNAEGTILSVNPAFVAMTGYSVAEALGRKPSILKSGVQDDAFYQEFWRKLTTEGHWAGEIVDRRKNGIHYPKWMVVNAVRERDVITHYVALFTDITERKRNEERIAHLAYHDTLTGLPNRLWLQEQAVNAFARARRNEKRLAVAFIDLDRFKNINDSLGHFTGDKLLMDVAKRLTGSVRASDHVIRLGGDEFLVLLEGLQDVNDAARAANHLHHSLDKPYTIDGKILHSPPSMGIALFPDNGHDIDTLVQHADTAMYQVKASGRNAWMFFEQVMNTDVMERMELENDLRIALDKDQFDVYYQPQWAEGGAVLCGWEALMRWRHPTRGLVPPKKFIPIAEDTGLILALGEKILRIACKTSRQWELDGIGRFNISVNLSARQFRQKNLVEQVQGILADTALPAGRLELEITEGVVMEDAASAIGILHQLKTLGVRLAIDDFGTGYSSLAYLKAFPIDRLKIDRSFVRDVTTDNNDAAIVSLIISLAGSLGLTTIAEGVENEAQLAFMRERGCHEIQGFLLGRPMPVGEATAFAREQAMKACTEKNE